jgi:hypothetical protein
LFVGGGESFGREGFFAVRAKVSADPRCGVFNEVVPFFREVD